MNYEPELLHMQNFYDNISHHVNYYTKKYRQEPCDLRQ